MAQYSIDQFSNLTGLNKILIRTWENRYNFIEPKRTDTNIRFYDDDMLTKGIKYSILVNNGHKISKVVKYQDTQVNNLIEDHMNDFSVINLSNRIKQLESEILTIENTNKRLEKENNSLQNDNTLNQTKKDLQDSKNTVDSLNSNITNLRTEINTINNILTEERENHSDEKEELNKDITTRNQQIKSLNSEIDDKQKSIDNLSNLNKELGTYTQKDHPVQNRIMTYVQDLLGSNNIPLEIDGCSAPTPFLTIEMIAVLFQKLGSGKKEELERVFTAMADNPYLIGGEKNFDTQFIKALKGSGVTKVGGESVRGITIKTKNRGCIGLAIKILDGNFRRVF